MKKPISWKEKFHEVKRIPEPKDREGFWEKKNYNEFQDPRKAKGKK